MIKLSIGLAALAALTAAGAQNQPAGQSDVRGLPLIEVPAPNPTNPAFAVFLSGDGGWATLDRSVVKELGAKGISTVVLNMRDYLWRRRTPDQSGADLTRILHHYELAWAKQKVIVIGYSRGADIAPFMVSRLPVDVRSDVVLLAMLAPGTTTNFQFHFRDLIADVKRSSDLLVLPEVEKLRGMNILCVYGADEKDSACRSAAQGLMKATERPGGHHFDDDFGALADIIESELRALKIF